MGIEKVAWAGLTALALAAGCYGRGGREAQGSGPAPAPPQAPFELRAPAGLLDVEASLREAGTRAGVLVAFDEALRGTEIELFTPAWLDRETLVAALDHYDVKLVEGEHEGRPILKVFLGRGSGRYPFPATMLRGLWTPPDGTEAPAFATALHAVGAGDGRAIEAALRARMKTDPARTGQATYVPGSRTLVITDLASRLPEHLALAAALDPPPARQTKRIVSSEALSTSRRP